MAEVPEVADVALMAANGSRLDRDFGGLRGSSRSACRATGEIAGFGGAFARGLARRLAGIGRSTIGSAIDVLAVGAAIGATRGVGHGGSRLRSRGLGELQRLDHRVFHRRLSVG